MTILEQSIVVWRIYDGRAGHDIQSQGLCSALSRLRQCQVSDIKAPSPKDILIDAVTGRFRAGTGLPNPDFIIGAGHRTHLPILCAKRARGGTSVVLMSPSLPCSWFDYCLIPEHDNPGYKDNIVTTIGALTTIYPQSKKDQGHGLILIGGPSKHYSWNSMMLIKQINAIVSTTSIKWQLTDSPRTPVSTSKALLDINIDNLSYTPYSMTSRKWLEEQFSLSAAIWVTEDSISMISEALSSGAAVGVLSTPSKKPGHRVARAVEGLKKANLVTPFTAWESTHNLSQPGAIINESSRCAEILLERAFSPR